jgi:hypothetical protein
MLPIMVLKTMDQHVVSNLASIIVMFVSSDLWMSCGDNALPSSLIDSNVNFK